MRSSWRRYSVDETLQESFTVVFILSLVCLADGIITSPWNCGQAVLNSQSREDAGAQARCGNGGGL